MNPKETTTERDARVMGLYEQLVEIEQRLIPTGLHVFGRAAELEEKADLLRMVASFDRPEHGARALPKLVAEALGINDYQALLQETSANETRDLVDAIVADAVRQFCEGGAETDRKSTRLNSSHQIISYAVFCLKKKNNTSKLMKNIESTLY